MFNRLNYRPMLLVGLALILLTGCAQGLFEHPPTPSGVVALCPPIIPYTLAQETAQASAYDALPAGSPLRSLIDDYGHERAALRACAAVK